MASTFFSLLDMADLTEGGASPPAPEDKDDDGEQPDAPPPSKERETHPPPAPTPAAAHPARPSLHYNIQIHLPATKDVEVFNAIFKSLRAHLLE